MRFWTGLTAAALLAAPAVAQTPEPTPPAAETGRQCFWSNQVNGFATIDDRSVNLRVGVREVYHLEFAGPCPDIDWSNQIGVSSSGGGQICSGLDAVIVTDGGSGSRPGRCMVRSVRKLTDSEVMALPRGAKP